MAFTLQLTHLQPATYPITACPWSQHCLLCRHSFSLLAVQLILLTVCVCWGTHRLYGCSCALRASCLHKHTLSQIAVQRHTNIKTFHLSPVEVGCKNESICMKGKIYYTSYTACVVYCVEYTTFSCFVSVCVYTVEVIYYLFQYTLCFNMMLLWTSIPSGYIIVLCELYKYIT